VIKKLGVSGLEGRKTTKMVLPIQLSDTNLQNSTLPQKLSHLTPGRLPDRIKAVQFIVKVMDTAAQPMARLEARLSPEVKALVQRAADLEGRTITDFVVASVRAEACRVIEQHTMLKLSLEDSQDFVNALLNPPPPNAALEAAAKRYKESLAAS
jgi:uncharacterized protein (DUF1778 family)